jgi:hypothetical protein
MHLPSVVNACRWMAMKAGLQSVDEEDTCPWCGVTYHPDMECGLATAEASPGRAAAPKTPAATEKVE